MVLRSSKFDSTTSRSHMNDILPLLAAQVKDGKGVAFVKVDDGSDWNLSYLVNQLYFFRVWRELGLDILGFISYAAKYSAYNNIEHLWSPLSKALSGVILPSVLEGENEIPCKQPLAPSVLEEKEKSVFDQAMQLVVSEYWKDLSFNNSEVRTDFKSCFLKESPYDDYKEVHTLLTGPYSKLRDSAKLMEELKMLFKHIDRKSNEVIFCKCTNPRCPHCTEKPIISTKVWDFLKEREFKWMNPKLSVAHPGHYLTCFDMCDVANEYLAIGDEGSPSTLCIGKCPVCPSYIFMSMAEKTRHMKVFHRFYVPREKEEHRCLYIVKTSVDSKRCSLVFETKNKLDEHKRQQQHLQRKRKTLTSSSTITKKLRLDTNFFSKPTSPVNVTVSEETEDTARVFQ